MSEEHVTEQQKEVIQNYMDNVRKGLETWTKAVEAGPYYELDPERVGPALSNLREEEWSIGTSRRLKSDAILVLDALADKAEQDAKVLRGIADRMRRGMI